MHKLVILIEPPPDDSALETAWPQFLHLVERLPDLRRETSSTVDQFLYGGTPYALMHELYFDTLEAARSALASPEGQAAGRLLQELTRGRLALFFADHKEDDLENIGKYQ
jgi:uncharacterized protein (TIGR02118 family)